MLQDAFDDRRKHIDDEAGTRVVGAVLREELTNLRRRLVVLEQRRQSDYDLLRDLATQPFFTLLWRDDGGLLVRKVVQAKTAGKQ